VWVLEPPAFLAGAYHGPEGVRTILRELAQVFDQFRVEIDDLIDAGDSVVGLGGFRVRGALSGATAPLQQWSVCGSTSGPAHRGIQSVLLARGRPRSRGAAE
jgi:ketosteroid isomerase-like protein